MKKFKFEYMVTTIIVIELLVIVFCAMFKPIYTNCHKTSEGKQCDLVGWERR